MKCVLCCNNTFVTITSKLRNNISRKVVRCKKCSLVSLKTPTKNTVNYSAKKYRKLHSPVLNKVLSPKEMFDSQIEFQKNRIDRVNHLLKSKSTVLEIGSSTGHFLFSIKNKVKKVVGIELDPRHAAFARKYCKIEVHEQPIEKIKFEQKFDVIFMFQVFEHIPNPLEFLSSCKKFLKPNGTMYIEVPNINDVLLSVYNISSFKEFYYREPHVYYYSEKTLGKMLRKAGFSGRTKTIQEYTMLNHIHWILTQKPQKSQSEGYNMLRFEDAVSKKYAKKLEKWLLDTNRKYQRILEQSGLGEHVCYIGKNISK